jgi:hypothetical protein
VLTIRRIYIAIKALYKFVVWSKCKKVTPFVSANRQQACMCCIHLKFNRRSLFEFDRFQCDECGCLIELKTWCIEEKCPLGKW